MSMESIKEIIAKNPGILQCDLMKYPDHSLSGNQIIKLVRRKEIVRVTATRKNAGNTYKLYLPEVL